jgi:hypothetical protein
MLKGLAVGISFFATTAVFTLSAPVLAYSEKSFAYSEKSFAYSPGDEYILQTEHVKGQVLKINKDLLIVRSDDGIKQYSVPSNIGVLKNSMSSSLSQLSPNDRVVLTVAADNEILAIEAMSATIFDYSRYVIPGASLLISILLILLIASANAKKREVTPSSPVSTAPNFAT